MAATEEDWKKFLFDDYLTFHKQTLIMFCNLLYCRLYFWHFQINSITVSMTCWGPRLPRALSAIWNANLPDGSRFSGRRFWASLGHHLPANQVIALPTWVIRAGPGWRIKRTYYWQGQSHDQYFVECTVTITWPEVRTYSIVLIHRIHVHIPVHLSTDPYR